MGKTLKEIEKVIDTAWKKANSNGKNIDRVDRFREVAQAVLDWHEGKVQEIVTELIKGIADE